MKKYFAVSDIHSFYTELLNALHSAGFNIDDPEHILVICGDLFDRGDKAVECLDFIKSLCNKSRAVYIRGNHEDLMVDCVRQISRGVYVSEHHISNGTVSTIAQLCNVSEWDIICNVIKYEDIKDKMDEVITFISRASCDYFPLGDTIFVHGWLPWKNEFLTHKGIPEDELDYMSSTLWKKARWENGMFAFHKKLVPKNVKVVCGHWHTSWGWCNLKQEGEEWGPTAKFDTLIISDETQQSTLIALDACTAHTHKVNCVVFDEYGNIVDKE